MKMDPEELQEMLDNASAIGTVMGRSPRWDEALKKAGDRISGFLGMWAIAAEAGRLLHVLSREKRIRWGVDAEWPGTIHTFAEEILTFLISKHRAPDVRELGRLAEESLSAE